LVVTGHVARRGRRAAPTKVTTGEAMVTGD
jgi:hypothetical protein